jgi:antibiotic biosynthesis monooxygenase (ABM) superfamily enzyme
MQAVAAQFPGHMGGFLIPPEQAEHGCYRMLFAFDTEAHLQDWMQSRDRHRRIADVTHADAATRAPSGLETWFALPAARTRLSPERWKMAIVTWTGIFPLVLLISYTIAPVLGLRIHPLLVSMASTGLITAAVKWMVMPNLVPLFASWLYPELADTAAPTKPPSEDS